MQGEDGEGEGGSWEGEGVGRGGREEVEYEDRTAGALERVTNSCRVRMGVGRVRAGWGG